MPDYKNGCVYLIKHNQDFNNENVYIGSCCNFTRRKCAHKNVCNNPNYKIYDVKLYKTIRENGGWNEWIMIKLHDYPCDSKYELNREERKVIDEYKAKLNCSIPTRTIKEYHEERYEENKDIIKEKVKEYREQNKDKIKQKDKERYKQNKEKIKQREKERYEENKDKIKVKNKQKVECEICKSIVSKINLTRHQKTQKCKNYASQ